MLKLCIALLYDISLNHVKLLLYHEELGLNLENRMAYQLAFMFTFLIIPVKDPFQRFQNYSMCCHNLAVFSSLSYLYIL